MEEVPSGIPPAGHPDAPPPPPQQLQEAAAAIRGVQKDVHKVSGMLMALRCT